MCILYIQLYWLKIVTVYQIVAMKSNMNDERKVRLGNANNPIPDIITPDLVEEAWNYSALSKVIRYLG